VAIRHTLIAQGLFSREDPSLTGAVGAQAMGTSWRIAPEPFFLSAEQVRFFQALGDDLLAFYRALNRLYYEGARGHQPGWVADYLDQGKPESLVAFSRMKRFKGLLPGVIRPDVIPTQDGFVITELDAVPGGIGLTAALARAYSEWPMADGRLKEASPDSFQERSAIRHQPSSLTARPYDIVGGTDGMIRGFAAMLQTNKADRTGCVTIVVSEEAKDYRPEMRWMADRLRESGLETYCVEPRDLWFTEDGLCTATSSGEQPVAVVYRFFELFDLMNIPKAELVMYSAKKERVSVTPPYKPALEEKLAFALLHHPVLQPFWLAELGEETMRTLVTLMPRTWILDPRPVPPSATIPGLYVGGEAVSDWDVLKRASQRDRHFAVKPSGFSELAWGSRGVTVGHDLPQTEWAAAIDRALAAFSATPYILQEFHKGRQFEVTYWDEAADDLVPMPGRTRLSPYYFVVNDRAELGGILATVCPADKKILHGMRDAIMAPCALAPEARGANSEC
jgi:hypothetical protein